jgi:hypothetical protein
MWKRLTSTTGDKVDINLNNVCYIDRGQDYTSIFFTVADQHGTMCSIRVREPPDGIHAAASPGSAQAS